MIRVRSARAEEADKLTKLCICSKAHWGYDAEFMRQSASALTVTEALIEQDRVLVAEDRHGRLMGVASVEAMQTQGKFDLSLLFVEPSAIRTGGRPHSVRSCYQARSGGWWHLLVHSCRSVRRGI